jgi:hypothetical protein
MLPAYARGNSRYINSDISDRADVRILPPLSRRIKPPLTSGRTLVEVEGAGICFRWTDAHDSPEVVLEKRKIGGERWTKKGLAHLC